MDVDRRCITVAFGCATRGDYSLHSPWESSTAYLDHLWTLLFLAVALSNLHATVRSCVVMLGDGPSSREG